VSLLSDSSWDLGTAFRIIGPGEETNLQLGISDGYAVGTCVCVCVCVCL
jgi:hypothetical protein